MFLGQVVASDRYRRVWGPEFDEEYNKATLAPVV